MDRTAIFIDGGYLDKLLDREFARARLDYGRLARLLAQGTDILRTYYYHCPPFQGNPPTDEERQRVAASDRFFGALSRLPRFQIRKGKLAYRGLRADGRPLFVQKQVDIMMGVDMVQLAATRQITRAVLLAGDSDFIAAIDAVKQHGVLVVLWHGPIRRGAESSVHHELWDACDERVELTAPLVAEALRPDPAGR